MSARARNGFTLLELLVALFIAAIMFAMGYGAINQALRSRGSIRQHEKSLVDLETAMAVMEQDFVQLAPRPVRDPLGDTYLPCLVGGASSDTSATAADTSDTSDTSDAAETSAPLVSLTRNGWSNPTGVSRPELERVAYVFENGTLVREHWNVLDATLSSTPVKRNLLKHLRRVTFRYMSPQHAWIANWPSSPLNVGGMAASDSFYRMRPLAVQVTLDTQQWGKIVRIFEIAQ